MAIVVNSVVTGRGGGAGAGPAHFDLIEAKFEVSGAKPESRRGLWRNPGGPDAEARPQTQDQRPRADGRDAGPARAVQDPGNRYEAPHLFGRQASPGAEGRSCDRHRHRASSRTRGPTPLRSAPEIRRAKRGRHSGSWLKANCPSRRRWAGTAGTRAGAMSPRRWCAARPTPSWTRASPTTDGRTSASTTAGNAARARPTNCSKARRAMKTAISSPIRNFPT